MKDGETERYPEFNPKKWNNKKVTWRGKLFIKDKVFTFFHTPLNFGSVVRKNIEKLEKADAKPKNMMVLSDEKSLFYNNIYISTRKAIPKVKDVKVSGTFLTKVFEGPHKNMKQWIEEMKEYVILEKQEFKHMYFYYPTCSERSKKHEKNHVVLFAEI